MFDRLGFAADSYPRFIIPTEIYNVEKKATKKLFEYKSKTELYEQMVEFIQKLFFKYGSNDSHTSHCCLLSISLYLQIHAS